MDLFGNQPVFGLNVDKVPGQNSAAIRLLRLPGSTGKGRCTNLSAKRSLYTACQLDNSFANHFSYKVANKNKTKNKHNVSSMYCVIHKQQYIHRQHCKHNFWCGFGVAFLTLFFPQNLCLCQLEPCQSRCSKVHVGAPVFSVDETLGRHGIQSCKSDDLSICSASFLYITYI